MKLKRKCTEFGTNAPLPKRLRLKNVFVCAILVNEHAKIKVQLKLGSKLAAKFSRHVKRSDNDAM